jgi:diguanylate cyclase (GGDEF)-like protein
VTDKGKRILVVDDDRENIALLTEFLSREGHTVTSASEGQGALHRLRAWKPHLILLDINMPGISGIDLIPKIRAATADDYVAIILVSSNMAIEDVTKGLDAGADDYLTKPFRPQELLARVRAMTRLKDLQDTLRRANHRVEELSSTDDLTGLFNMRALHRKGDEEIVRSRRFRKPVSGLLINLDGFAAVNETAGFNFGSLVLKSCANLVKGCVRSVDLVGRVGSDEYFVVLPETDLAGAEFVAERIRDAVQGHEFKADKNAAKLTVCIGIAGFAAGHNEGDMGDLYRHANEALRSAKMSGPNKVEIYSFA